MMFAVLFGLSMDYQVFLISRIEEHGRRRGRQRAAIGAVWPRTGARVIAAAALIMIASSAASS